MRGKWSDSYVGTKWSSLITVSAADTTAPTPGTGLTFSSITSSSITVSWGAATDDVTPQASLQYKLVRSSTNNIDTVANAEANGTTVLDWTTNDLTEAASSLSSSTTYWFNTLVKDAAGNKAAYTQLSQATADYSTKSLQGDGVDEYMDCGSTLLNGVTGAFSVSVWFKLNALTDQCICSKDYRDVGKRMFQIQYYPDAGPESLIAYVWDQSAGSYLGKTTNGALSTGVWYHACLVYDGGTDANNSVKLYLNNAAQTTNFSGGAFSGVDTTDANFLVGAYKNPGGSFDRFFNGIIDEPAVFQAELSATDVSNIYNSGNPADLSAHAQWSNALATWRMGELDDTITQIKDRKNTYHGTPTNMEAGDIVTDAP